MKKRKAKKVVGNCDKGHLMANVKTLKVSRFLKGEKYIRLQCRCCKMEMDLPNNSNLIGNPFGIKELFGAYKDEEALSAVDAALCC